MTTDHATASLYTTPDPTTYSLTIKTLHWLIGVAILGQIVLGWLMTDNDFFQGPTRSNAYALHKSIGITLLVLCLCRCIVHVRSTRPTLPQTMAPWERLAATLTHQVLLGLPILVAFVGWMILSTQPRPSLYFDLFTIPNLPILPDLADKINWRTLFITIHGALAWAIIGCVALHVGAAGKHHFINRDDILTRMMPGFLVPLLEKIRGR